MTVLTSQSTEPIPGYTLKERLGAGGYGEVWKSEAPGGLLKAIKFIYGYHDEDRAARELKALNRIKQVRHPFLLSLERIEIIDGQLVIVTELADSCLKDVYTKHRGEGLPGIPREELIQYVRDTADALDYMNEQFQLQHLDIKPENLLLVGGRIKVGDFGLVKDIHDNSMSMMGGLTPVYAPPEVFDGRPSRRSDQYSLAIVFQHMLTGELPFGGRTAAQLASQHLHERPRLLGLPPEDQPVIEKALAKNPEDRFASCREMIEQLATRRAAGGWSKSEGTGHFSNRPTNTSGGVGTPRRTMGRTELMDAEQSSAPSVEVRVSRQEALRAGSGYFEGDTFVPKLTGAPRVVALPPLEDVKVALNPRPTLFIGVGGSAAAAIKALQMRVADRLGAALPAFPVLLIDTDVQALKDTEYACTPQSLGPVETLPIPLRKSQDYKSASYQAWLSRRWLYNIPRSLKTEGLRPLGRLALADHAPLLRDRLQQALAAAIDPEAMARTSAVLEAPLRERLRVVILASISGGAGSGASLDLAYLVRQALEDLGIQDAEIDGVFTHSTSRNPQMKELALANAFAFLRELNHYQRRGYPGDRTCGVPCFEGTPPFHSTYMVHLGDDLNDEGFATSIERVAEYLFLDSFTTVGDLLERSREAKVRLTAASGEPTVRSFGVCALGAAGRSDVAGLVDSLCRGVLDRWRGQPEATWGARLSCASPATKTDDLPEPPLDPLAVERAGGLRIELDEWLRRIQQIVEAILRSDPDRLFASMVDDILPPAHDHEPPGDLATPALNALRVIHAILGYRDTGDDFQEPPEDNVTDNLEERLELLATRQAAAIQRCVGERLDAPRQMVRSAQQLLKEYEELLRQLDQQGRAARQSLDATLKGLKERIRTFQPLEPRRGAARNPAPAPQQVMRQLLLDYARQRLVDVYLQGACKLALAVNRRVAVFGDELKELGRGLDKAVVQFPLRHDDEASHAGAIVASLRSRMRELVSVLDAQFRSSFFPPGEGFRVALRKDFQFAERLPDALRDAARRVALDAVRSTELAGVLFPEDEDPLKAHERLASIVQAAQPHLIHCGGGMRSLLVLPESSRESRLPGLFSSRLGHAPVTVFDPRTDATYCCEMEQISVATLAAMLIDHRRDYAEAASRLHTRNDVNWSPWPRPSEPRAS